MDLFRLAAKATEEEFRADALTWLQTQIGFDGVAWGSGERQPDNSTVITRHDLVGRPQSLISDYAEVGKTGPIAKRFAISPQNLRMVSTHLHYRAPALRLVFEYLEHYRVRQLMLIGMPQSRDDTLDWVACYREDQGRPFDPALANLYANAMRSVLLAGQLRQSVQASFPAELPTIQHACLLNNACPCLTERQLQVLEYLLHGWPNKLISRQLGISENTLKKHIAAIFAALKVASRAEAITVVERWCKPCLARAAAGRGAE